VEREQDLVQEGEGGKRPWERPGAVRRDCEPHRGRLILTLGGLPEFCAAFACLLGVTAPLAVGFGVSAWLLARRDLARMREGRMDPEGRQSTELGGTLGLAGAGPALIFVAALFMAWRLQILG
jgi:hypothetical protein